MEKKPYRIKYFFKWNKLYRPQGLQEEIVKLDPYYSIKEAFEYLYNKYGEDYDSIASVEEVK